MSIRGFALEVLQRLIVKLTNDDGAVQVMQLEGERVGAEVDVVEFEAMLPYGIVAHPPVGAEAIVGHIDGDSSQGVVLTAQHREHRPKGLKEGEVGLHYFGDMKVFLAEDGNVHLGARAANDSAACASIVDDRLDAIEQKLNDLIATFNAHTHVAPMGATTGPLVPETPLTPGASTASPIVKVQR